MVSSEGMLHAPFSMLKAPPVFFYFIRYTYTFSEMILQAKPFFRLLHAPNKKFGVTNDYAIKTSK